MENKENDEGYGRVFRRVLRSKLLEAESKAIYAYLAGFAGKNNTCYPTKELMCTELLMSPGRFSKYMRALIDLGVVKVERQKNGNLKSNNLYILTHSIKDIENEYIENKDIENKDIENRHIVNEYIENKDIENRHIVNEYTNNNSLNNNSLNNKENRTNYQQIVDMYNDTCVSFPRVTKLSESRKKAIKARLRTYTPEDFRQLFQMAEESSFLKGANARNWSANFDWLITDSNMCKVLSGNYSNRKESSGHTQEKNVSDNRFINFEQRTYDYEQLERELLSNQD